MTKQNFKLRNVVMMLITGLAVCMMFAACDKNESGDDNENNNNNGNNNNGNNNNNITDCDDMPDPGSHIWFDDWVWKYFGLQELTMPSGLEIMYANTNLKWCDEKEKYLTLGFEEGANLTVFNSFLSQITNKLGGKISLNRPYSGKYITLWKQEFPINSCLINYRHADTDYILNLVFRKLCTNNVWYDKFTLEIRTKPAKTEQWPSNSTWSFYGLSGFTLPQGAIVTKVSDNREPGGISALYVSLTNIDQTTYENLISQVLKSQEFIDDDHTGVSFERGYAETDDDADDQAFLEIMHSNLSINMMFYHYDF